MGKKQVKKKIPITVFSGKEHIKRKKLPLYSPARYRKLIFVGTVLRNKVSVVRKK